MQSKKQIMDILVLKLKVAPRCHHRVSKPQPYLRKISLMIQVTVIKFSAGSLFVYYNI